jgi:hypothetical protein
MFSDYDLLFLELTNICCVLQEEVVQIFVVFIIIVIQIMFLFQQEEVVTIKQIIQTLQLEA